MSDHVPGSLDLCASDHHVASGHLFVTPKAYVRPTVVGQFGTLTEHHRARMEWSCLTNSEQPDLAVALGH